MTSLKEKILTKFSRPLIIVGGLSKEHRGTVYECLNQIPVPLYLEAPSGLRGAAGLSACTLQSGASFLNEKNFRAHFNSVLRLGSVPTLRLWRDLDGRLQDVPVLSVNHLPFSGLSREKTPAVGFANFFSQISPSLLAKVDQNYAAEVLDIDRKLTLRLASLLEKWPRSEPGFVRWLGAQIPHQSLVMLGNSLPIREWDLAASFEEKGFHIEANRGANGIDGLIATFLGMALEGKENWLILGDLSALYDLNALAQTHNASSSQLRIVVMNNNGGQIFNRMFRDKNFLNSHSFEFQRWAEMFGWRYLKVTEPSATSSGFILEPFPTVIEIQPCQEETEKFWEHYQELFQ